MGADEAEMGVRYEEVTMAGRPSESRTSTREQTRAALLKDALDRPGIREIMRVYEDWRHVDRGLDSYRAANREPQRILTTDHANQR